MSQFLAVVFGLFGGAISLFFLSKSMKNLLQGQTIRTCIFMMLNIISIAIVLLLIVLWNVQLLGWTGAGITTTLVIGAFVYFFHQQKKYKNQKKDDNEPDNHQR